MSIFIGDIDPLSEFEFKKLKELIYDNTGIFLKDTKVQMVNSRLQKRLKTLGINSYKAYYEYLVKEDDGAELIEMINSITTNKTDYFREKHHFDYLLNTILPKLKTTCYSSSSTLNIRIWCAASSTGEEPYTIAMVLKDYFENNTGWSLKVLASDIDTRVLAAAKQGVYSSQQISPIPVELLKKYFYKGEGENEGLFKVKEKIKDIIDFRKINLIDDTYPINSQVDVIFCRNVFIYFDKETIEKILEKFYRHLKPGGYLFIGHSETMDLAEKFKGKFELVFHTTYLKV